MKQVQRSQLYPVFSLVSVFLSGGLLLNSTATAQIVPDTTLGSERSIIRENVNINGSPGDRIEGGASRGANLFHSFREFNIPESGRVYFANPAGIENILTRVTGDNISNILGTLGVEGTANLFLINPNGIYFGPNARLDVGGSFFASSADSIVFENGIEFNATNPATPPLLTINIPLGLQLRNNPANLQVDRSQLGVKDSQTLALVGGNININGALLQARSGQIELAGVNGGIVGIEENRLNIPANIQRSDVLLSDNSNLQVIGNGRGNINIFARNISIENNEIALRAGIAQNNQSPEGSTPGNIQINATESVNIINSKLSNIVDQTGVGNGGQIIIKANNLTMREGAALDSRVIGSGANNERIAAQGNAGSVLIDVAGTVSLDRSFINTNIGRNAIGNSGDINIQTGSLILSNSSQLNTVTSGGNLAQPSKAGNVNVNARNSVNMIGVGGIDAEQQTGIFTKVDQGAIGQGGDIEIQAGSLSLNNSAVLDSRVIGSGENNEKIAGQGDAGAVRLNILGAANFENQSRVNTNVGARVLGDSGTIEIIANSLSFRNGSELNTGNSGLGYSGDITITITGNSLSLSQGSNLDSRAFRGEEERPGNAGNITINAERAVVTLNQGYIITTVGDRVLGNSGDINIRAGFLSVNNGSRIEANTSGGNTIQPSKAGNITLNVRDRIAIDGVNNVEEIDPNIAPKSSGIFSQLAETGVGIGGNIDIQARSLTLTNGGQLSADTFGIGDTGYINIEVEDAVEIAKTFNNGVNIPQLTGIFSRVNNGAVGSGQEIRIQAGSLSILEGTVDSRVRGSGANNERLGGQGNAGNISFNIAGSTVLDKAYINTNIGRNVLGNSGFIEIESGSLLMRGGSQLNSNTSGGSFEQPSQAGEVRLKIRDRLNLEGLGMTVDPAQQTKITTEVDNWGVGEAGQVKIEVTNGSFIINNNAALVTRVRRAQTDENTGEIIIPAGQGNGGDVNINVRDDVIFDSNSLILTTVGDEVLGTRSGNVDIESNSVYLNNNSRIITATGGSPNALQTPSVAGNISLQVSDLVYLSQSQIISSATQQATGADGGNININAQSIFLENSAITAGNGTLNPVEENSAGQIVVTAPNLRFNTGILQADTQRDRTETASITVNSQDLRLQTESNFTTNANETDGGNITINTETLVGLKNSDITANADGGAGGAILINAEGIFGSNPLTRQQVEERLGEEQIQGNPQFSQDLLQNTSDIVAISTTDAALSGTVDLNSALDPSKGLVELPQQVIDPAALIAQDPCKQGDESELILTGRGGIPSTPDNRFTGENVRVELVEPSRVEDELIEVQQPVKEQVSSANIIPARGWIRTANGEVILVGYDPTRSGIQRQPRNSPTCSPPSENSEIESKN
ncbi:filamentous hemagglutinin N-terminal domain-containing protein [Capilliphycus salinus ALCB114379]|uniref:two-partner secretion domain-containing protein n=1 Tax=Capilliphycus salinus TaxID=2768948 RepID=UPI0039A4C50D